MGWADERATRGPVIRRALDRGAGAPSKGDASGALDLSELAIFSNSRATDSARRLCARG